MPTYDLAGFTRAVESIAKRVPEVHRDLQVEVAAGALQYAVYESPVLTGAYRASHTIDVGESESANAVYWGPELPGADEIITPGSRPILAPPDGPSAQAALADVAPFQRLQLHNRRFYASLLEYGTASMEPRPTYAKAEAEARRMTQAASEEAARRLTASGR